MFDRARSSAGVAGLALLAATIPSIATNATTMRVPARAATAHRATTFVRSRAQVRRDVATGCTTNQGTPGAYFVGTSAGLDTAGGVYSGVMAGYSNEACDDQSAIGGGRSNTIGNSDNATSSFLGAGEDNSITAADAFVGAGAVNQATGQGSFVGSGVDNETDGPGSFAGAGGTVYQEQQGTSSIPPPNNLISGADSFVGAGDLNEITGTGSFIGAGGTAYAGSSTKPTSAGNTVKGQDSFLGAGDVNNVGSLAAFVGAGFGNVVNPGASFAFIGSGTSNTVSGTESSIGGGNDNTIAESANLAFVGGGYINTLDGQLGFIGGGGSNSITSAGAYGSIVGGYKNVASAKYAAIIGGNLNTASGEYATVLGGYSSTASGTYSIVAGGDSNSAAGTLSYVAGYHADAVHSGSFVWSDYSSGSAVVSDKAANQFVLRASGGYFLYSNEAATAGVELTPGSGTWASLSDRNAKTHVVPLDGESMLAKIDALPIDAWQYRSERGVRHAGPMAQDFYAAFGLGTDDRHITSIDEDGVALAAIKALHAQLARTQASERAKDDEIGELRREVAVLAKKDHVRF